jgi:hypothetical protein
MFLDTTAIKANIHFPIDWVLLRDGVISLRDLDLDRFKNGSLWICWNG